MGITVLVVDDETPIRRLVCSILRGAGYHVLEAQDGLAALNLIATTQTPVGLLITDLQMPNMTGPELLDRLLPEHPNLKVLCISGYSDVAPPVGRPFLAKPFTALSLTAAVEAILEAA